MTRPAPRPGASPDRAFQSILGESSAIRTAIALARKAAATRATVLLTGETGTGKELFARGIHYAGATSDQPFVAINCAAIPGTLLESELFGHEKGAFTGAQERKQGLIELAGNGTLFLDEIGELPLDLQPKLLRALQERHFRRVGGTADLHARCRFIAATNTLLEDAVARGEFRPDLLYRLNVLRIDIPPLREREDDIELLARHFLQEAAREHGLGRRTLHPAATAALRAYHWPGNVRELRNVMERAALLADGEVVGPEHILLQHRTPVPAPWAAVESVGEIRIPPAGKTLRAIEEEAVRITLQLTRYNQSAAARLLGISRPTLARIMRRCGLGPRNRPANVRVHP